MNRNHKGMRSTGACIVAMVLIIAMLTGCSDNSASGTSDDKNKVTATEGTAPLVQATTTPTEDTAPTAAPTEDTTPSPTEGTATTPTQGTTTTTPTKAPTKTPTKTPTKAPTSSTASTPAPTIAQSDSGTSKVVENSAAPVPTDVKPTASGDEVYTGNGATVDASHKADGYIMAMYGDSGVKKKLRITMPDGTVYTYNLNSSDYETFPLSGGNGDYTIKIYKNVSGTKYSTVFSQTISVKLKDQFAPFLHSNQYVNYSSSSQAVAKARSITSGCSSTLDKVQKVYTYVATNISYDYDKAASVKSGYLPNIDKVLSSGKGICFDYAALMTAMLRSQKIPTKLVVGYAGSAYHAWISVYVSGQGWIDGVIYFDGKSWEVMDPTFASTQGSEAIKNTTYSAKYLY